MKPTSFLILVPALAVLFAACNGAETKADGSAEMDKNEMTGEEPKADTSAETDKNEMTGAERVPEEKMPEKKPAASSTPGNTSNIPNRNEIVAKIDQYLVSTGNLAGATVTVKNTLSAITFQKAIVEVTFLGPDGKMIRTEYFTIQNIEPGDVETIKLANTAKVTSLVTHVVKIKSDALTNGEMVLSGTHFEAGK
jgi:hypothetical protein